MVRSGRHRRDGVDEVPWYETRRSARRRPGRLGPAAVGTGSVLLVAGAVLVGSTFFPAHLAGRTGCDGPQTSARVAAAPDHVEVLKRIAAEWSLDQPRVGGACASVQVVAANSATMVSTLGIDKPDARPDVWAPESSVWAGLATSRPEAAAALPPSALGLATTPVVIAVSHDRAKALGWPQQKLSWRAVLGGMSQDPTWGRYGHASWGRFVIGMSDPARSTAALHTLLTVADGNNDGAVEPGEVTNELTLERSVGVYGTEAQLLEQTGGTGPISAFPTTEQAVLQHNASGEAAQLVPVYPADGLADADHPFLILRGAWVTSQKRQVAQAFADFALGSAGRAAYGLAGFRDRDRSASELPRATGTVAETYPTRALPAAAQTAQALVRWRALRRPANVLAVIDTSGSMAENAPGLPVTKLAVFQKAAAQAVRLFNARSRLGLWEFSSQLSGGRDYKELVPARPLGQKTGPVDQRTLIIAAAQQMRAVGNTGLYDTIEASYREITRNWRSDQQNILMVMTDGKNEDLSGLSLPQLVSSLRARRDAKRPVTVILVAYGVDADVPALNAAATAAGGRTYVARDPTDIGKVFLAAMVNR